MGDLLVNGMVLEAVEKFKPRIAAMPRQKMTRKNLFFKRDISFHNDGIFVIIALSGKRAFSGFLFLAFVFAFSAGILDGPVQDPLHLPIHAAKFVRSPFLQSLVSLGI